MCNKYKMNTEEILLDLVKESGVVKIIIDMNKKCTHSEITHIIYSGWDRDQHVFECDHCKKHMHVGHDEFNYRNVKKTVDY